uniref:AB hydrolase-1 domain-containing protein n=1 Tax=Eutreptiella gymnastica TaxID=73025 RepID=A0A7S1JG12_9EUGL
MSLAEAQSHPAALGQAYGTHTVHSGVLAPRLGTAHRVVSDHQLPHKRLEAISTPTTGFKTLDSSPGWPSLGLFVVLMVAVGRLAVRAWSQRNASALPLLPLVTAGSEKTAGAHEHSRSQIFTRAVGNRCPGSWVHSVPGPQVTAMRRSTALASTANSRLPWEAPDSLPPPEHAELLKAPLSDRQFLTFYNPCPDEAWEALAHEEPSPSNPKPILMILPGTHGTALTMFVQFPELKRSFELLCLELDARDRSQLHEIRSFVIDEIKLLRSQGRTVCVLGESFGGLLALDVAARTDVDGLAVVNPATSWNTSWPSQAGVWSKVLPAPLVTLICLAIALATGDKGTFTNLWDAALGKQPKGELEISPADRDYMYAMLPTVIERMSNPIPLATLEWRLFQWLYPGSRDFDQLSECPQLWTQGTEVLILCGDEDSLLPSREEGVRLRDFIPNSRLRYVETAGHMGWSDQRLDLRKELAASWFTNLPKDNVEPGVGVEKVAASVS